MKTTTLPLRHSVNHLRRPLVLLLVPLALVCLALSPQAGATCQEGCNLTNANTFLGDNALDSDTTGNSNVAIGSQALFSNTSGSLETAIGWGALFSNISGYGNSAFGGGALYNNTTGFNNTASGHSTLNSNTTGSYNVANGVAALQTANGSHNVAMGYATLSNVIGGDNTAIGEQALRLVTSGDNNIALGALSGYNLLNGSNNIIIGNRGVSADDGLIRIGTVSTHRKAFIAGINGVTVANGVGVIVNPQGQLGTVVSSERYKDHIQPMDKASEAILALKPVTFRYKHELDPDGIPQFGLVAEEVEKVNPDLVARDEVGKPYTVRYEAVNAMLLNEFLKEHRRNQQQESKIEQQEAKIARLEKQIETLSSGLQQVSAQLELAKAAPQTVQNSP